MSRYVHVRFLLFAAFREAVGTGELALELPPHSTVEMAYTSLLARAPAVGPLRPYATFAVNRQVVDASCALHDGDEVAVLQPMSGGSL